MSETFDAMNPAHADIECFLLSVGENGFLGNYFSALYGAAPIDFIGEDGKLSEAEGASFIGAVGRASLEQGEIATGFRANSSPDQSLVNKIQEKFPNIDPADARGLAAMDGLPMSDFYRNMQGAENAVGVYREGLEAALTNAQAKSGDQWQAIGDQTSNALGNLNENPVNVASCIKP